MDRLRPPPSSGSHGGYARSFLATLLLILSVVGAATSTLDPFGIHRWIEVPGINAHKPATHARVRMFKAYEVERVKPETVILGSSRSHVGFSCRHPALARLPGPCYNLAFDGATTREMFEYLVHANEIRPLRTVLLGLDTSKLPFAQHWTSMTALFLYFPGLIALWFVKSPRANTVLLTFMIGLLLLGALGTELAG